MKRITIAIITACAHAAAHADTLYISDKLVVSAYAEASQESTKVATLDSGDAVEAMEKGDGYTHVRLSDNREGWIKSSYLSSQVPAIVRLKELEKERGGSASPNAALTEEIKQLKDRNSSLQSEVDALKQAATQTVAAPVAAVMPASQGRLEGEQSTREEESFSWLQHASWSAAVLVAGGAIGFLLGYQALARRIRRKYGSVKIY
jgi:SH3 domain protein